MSGSLRGYPAQNVLVDLANVGRGERDQLQIDQSRRELETDRAFRDVAGAAAYGDQNAMRSAIAADPERGLNLRRAIEGLDDASRMRGLRNLELMGQTAASFLDMPDDQAAAAYPGALNRLKAAGIDTTSFPQQYPGRSVIEQAARQVTSASEQLRAYNSRVVPQGDTSQPRGIRNNNPLNIEAGGFASSMPGFVKSDGRFAVFETPEQGIAAADALLLSYGVRGRDTVRKIIERWAPSSDGNNVESYAGTVSSRLGIRPDDPLPMQDPQVRQKLIQAMAEVENGPRAASSMLVHRGTGLPVTQGAQPGKAWARGPDGQPVQVPIAGAGERIQPPEGFQPGPDGRLQPIPGGPKDPAYLAETSQAKGGKTLPTPERTKLIDAGQRLTQLDGLAQSFDPAYAGYGSAIIGDAANYIARNTPGESNRANWWQGYQSLKNVVRNEMFGAALTATEKGEFEKSDINPGMSADTVRANLKRQVEIVQRAIARRSSSLAKDGYNRDAIEEATGLTIEGAPAGQGRGAVSATERRVVRTGTTPDGRRVVQYSDGSIEAAP